jgi:small subunit ribosomal protein S11
MSYLELSYINERKIIEKFSGFYFGPLVTYRLAILFVSKRRRNIFFTLTDLTGSVLCSIASSFFQFPRKQRFSALAFELMLKQIEQAIYNNRINFIEVVLRIKSRYFIKTIFSFLSARKIKFSRIHLFVPIPFNGCRKKKKRRI